MLRLSVCASVLLIASPGPLGKTGMAGNVVHAGDTAPLEDSADNSPESASFRPLRDAASGDTRQTDNIAPDGTSQTGGSEWLAVEPLPPPENVPAPAIDTRPSAPKSETGAPPVLIEPIGEPSETTAGDSEPPPIRRQLGDFWGYRTSQQSISWTIGDGDQFGNFSLDPNPYLKSGATSGLHMGLGVKFLSGPERTDLPPRVFDISIGCQIRRVVGNLAYDVSFSVLAATDFEGSCRDGIRFPAHAVGYFALTPNTDLMFGFDYLDRADIRVLPVGGLLLRPTPPLRIELAFPRPRIELQLTPDYRIYLRGGLGGGTWAIERDSQLDDLATLYELELGVGVAARQSDGDWGASELVYLFDRKLDYESNVGDYRIGPTMMLRLVTLY